MEERSSEEPNEYNAWHEQHVGDNDISTPWHNFAKDSIDESDMENKQVLEIGCGRGGFSDYLSGRFTRIGSLYACDYSDTALQLAINRSKSDSKIVWQREDIQKLSFLDVTFDTIISCETIEHVPSPGRALTELYRVLKPGGKFILTCPNYFNLFGIWCLYRKIIGKPYTEGGQPYVNYLMFPFIYFKIKSLGFSIQHYHSAELVLPARVPKTFYPTKVPGWLSILGSRTYYVLKKSQ
jgi:SAM-dependent methyltransferase